MAVEKFWVKVLAVVLMTGELQRSGLALPLKGSRLCWAPPGRRRRRMRRRGGRRRRRLA